MTALFNTRSLPAVMALLVAGAFLAVPAGAVTLREEAEVALPPFTLQDVTRESLTGEIASVELGRLPEPGRTRFISRAYIKMQARSQQKPIPSFNGPVSQLEVRRPTRLVGKQEIREQVYGLLRDELAVTDSVDIQVRKAPDSMTVLPGPYTLRLDSWNPYRAERGTTNYRINVRQRGQTTTEFSVTASITQHNKVPVANQPIARGQTITPDLIQWKEREISSLGGNIIRSKKAIIGFEADRSFESGDIITGDELEKPILIDRGDPITIVLKQGSFKVTTKGEARERGARGDRIMVENRSSEVQLLAEVIGERRVLIRDAQNDD